MARTKSKPLTCRTVRRPPHPRLPFRPPPRASLTHALACPAADVVLTTHGTHVFGEFGPYIRIHRLIIDESHTPEASRCDSAPRLMQGRCAFAWGVTGTPLSSSVNDLGFVAGVVGHWGKYPYTLDTPGGLKLHQYTQNQAGLVDALKRLMIRHTKSQRIGGEAALSLPDAECETVWLEMSAAEKRLYKEVQTEARRRIDMLIAEPQKAATFCVENALRCVRQACAGAGIAPKFLCEKYGTKIDQRKFPNLSKPGGAARTKLSALLADLQALRAKEPKLHAVVFTHHVEAYESISECLKKHDFEVCGFKGGVQAADRHATIRAFQASIDQAAARAGTSSGAAHKKQKVGSGAKVFIATMKVGNVGITLTAATRVYLMEPCLDPTMEVQAAGRIHRLGQTKEVLVKRFCHKDSIDKAIVELHKKIKSGGVAIANSKFPLEALKLLEGNI